MGASFFFLKKKKGGPDQLFTGRVWERGGGIIYIKVVKMAGSGVGERPAPGSSDVSPVP